MRISQLKLYTQEGVRKKVQIGTYYTMTDAITVINEVVGEQVVSKGDVLDFYKEDYYQQTTFGILYCRDYLKVSEILHSNEVNYEISRPNFNGIVMKPCITFVAAAVVDLYVFRNFPEHHEKLEKLYETLAIENKKQMILIDPPKLYDVIGKPYEVVTKYYQTDLLKQEFRGGEVLQLSLNNRQLKRAVALATKTGKLPSTILDEALIQYEIKLEKEQTNGKPSK